MPHFNIRHSLHFLKKILRHELQYSKNIKKNYAIETKKGKHSKKTSNLRKVRQNRMSRRAKSLGAAKGNQG